MAFQEGQRVQRSDRCIVHPRNLEEGKSRKEGLSDRERPGFTVIGSHWRALSKRVTTFAYL